MSGKDQTEVYLLKPILINGVVYPAGSKASTAAVHAKELVELGYAQHRQDDSETPEAAVAKTTPTAKESAAEKTKEAAEKEQEQTDDANNSADAEAPAASGAGRKGRGRRTSAAAASGD